MQTQPNTHLRYFNGYCPACNRKGKQQQLRLSSNDFWKCQVRDGRLQLTTVAPYAAILRWRREGTFRQTVQYLETIATEAWVD